MDQSSIHRGVCCFNVPFPQHTPVSHSSLILSVFCGMTNEGFREDFLLPTLNNSDREKESSLVIFLSHGPRLVRLVMSHGVKAPLSAGEKKFPRSQSQQIWLKCLRNSLKQGKCSLLLLPFLHLDVIFFLISVMSFSFSSLFLHLPCSSLKLATLWSISSLQRFLTHGEHFQQPLYLMIIYDSSNNSKYWLRRRHERGPCILQCRLEVSWKWIVIFSSKPADANSCTLQKGALAPCHVKWWFCYMCITVMTGRGQHGMENDCSSTPTRLTEGEPLISKKETRYHCQGETCHNAAFVGNRLVITLRMKSHVKAHQGS